MKSLKNPTADWEFLLWDPGPPPPRPPRWARLLAAARTVRAARLLRRRGWPAAQHRLRTLRPAVRDVPAPPEAIRAARREVLSCLTALRLADPDALCLPRSYALATYFTTLGLPVQIVVARQRSSIGGRFACHAWAELYGEVLADIPGVRTGFTVLQRFGSEHVRGVDTEVPERRTAEGLGDGRAV
ncbi:lasso peptide biosynthesis B2 protein [Streptomyces sp. ISL-22]|uniref:lasso peptide biosynthesis B2 protein n=1 Tax=unclassified Streptomyces TaxID=2593676 RepID=UPI001BE65E65|nr:MULTISPECIES: lasso peptide biosynthesis B2 protein [unclassified Streptomyces]MBT2418579.1 lasso peptide biosynthesis B2 protein [Streptomyces sp. ISL-24]MBT2434318.1 lasso peptide biosynthesis B2 protein [Streptomyces sp. ISL-22]